MSLINIRSFVFEISARVVALPIVVKSDFAGRLIRSRGLPERLLGKLRGELQQPGALHVHKHSHIHSAAQPRNEAEIELEIARHVAAATANFDAQEITRLKGLLEVATPQSIA